MLLSWSKHVLVQEDNTEAILSESHRAVDKNSPEEPDSVKQGRSASGADC